ncbi:hypothetical protein MMC29_003355 [Sticta canariensis]|nr:hypothetical protein [Sticta canariensis]
MVVVLLAGLAVAEMEDASEEVRESEDEIEFDDEDDDELEDDGLEIDDGVLELIDDGLSEEDRVFDFEEKVPVRDDGVNDKLEDDTLELDDKVMEPTDGELSKGDRVLDGDDTTFEGGRADDEVELDNDEVNNRLDNGLELDDKVLESIDGEVSEGVRAPNIKDEVPVEDDDDVEIDEGRTDVEVELADDKLDDGPEVDVRVLEPRDEKLDTDDKVLIRNDEVEIVVVRDDDEDVDEETTA